MELRKNNIQVTKRYEELVNEHYKEPVNESFDDVMASVLQALVSDELEPESDVSVDIGKWLFEGIADIFENYFFYFLVYCNEV